MPGTLGKEDIGNTGLSNQVYANVCITHISKEEEPNTVVDTAEPVSEDYFKEEEVINGEFEAKEFETDAGEVDSTYYNVAGKRVTVANLPEYIKSKRLGDIYADFQVRVNNLYINSRTEASTDHISIPDE